MRTPVPRRSPTVTASLPPSVRTRICSRLPRSMSIDATLRVRRARAPLAVTPICSPMLEPLKSSVSLPEAPSTVSLPSPGSHSIRSLPVPPSTVSAPMLPSMSSSPEPPRSFSVPAAPRSVSLPAPPSTVIGLSSAPPPLIEVDAVVAALGVHLDLAERAAVEREVGRAVVADVEDVAALLVDDRERLLAVVTEDLQRVAVELRAGGGGGGSGGDGQRRDGDQARSPYQARSARDGPAMWVSGHTRRR